MSMEAAVEMRGITKSFGTVMANDHIDITLRKGEILALLGENGSGKTTLVNILSGIYYPDEGRVFIDGRETVISSPTDAYAAGIGMIHQHFKLVDVFTAAENIVLGYNEAGRKFNLKETSDRIRSIAARYGFEIDPDKKIYDMSVSEKQTVEIIKALYRGARILILDEPTAVLTPQETDKLFDIMRNMKNDGRSIIIITHKLAEVMEISDRVALLRGGKCVDVLETKDTDSVQLASLMVGRSVSLEINRPAVVGPQDRLVLSGLTYIDREGVKRLDDVSFTARSGEILGIAGVAGSGQKELLDAVAGLIPLNSGNVTYLPGSGGSIKLNGLDPRQIRKLGISISFVPEDRLGMGLVGAMGMTDNMMLRTFDEGKGFFVRRNEPRKLADKIKDELDVATPGINFPVRRLSGGNVQKVLVGREIAASPAVLMLAYAVRGLDINTSHVIYDLLTQQKMKGPAVIYVGEDLDVLMSLCDRIVVLVGGQVSGVVDARTTSKEEIGLLMTSYEKRGDLGSEHQ